MLVKGGSISLGSDITLDEQVVIPEGVEVKLNLNGYSINAPETTGNHIYVMSNKGTLTISDTSAEQDGSINSRGIWNHGTLTLNSGKISAIDGNGGYAVNNESGATFVMNGGWLAADNEDGDAPGAGSDATALDVPSGCTATLNAGKITNAGNFTFAVDVSGGTLNIPETSTITIEGRHGAIYVSAGKATINAGTFSVPENTKYTDNVIYITGGELIINGGTFIADNDGPSGGTCVSDGKGCATINGGTFGNSSGGDVWGTTGTKINGGTFENLTEISLVTDGATIINGGKTYKKIDGVMVEQTAN